MIDFLVIGGGIAGISAGARLSHLGHVVVLEKEAGLGYHASGRSAAMFEETYGLESTLALNRASKAYHMEANGGVLSPRGLMIVGRADEAERFEAELAMMGMEEIGLEAGRAIVPILGGATARVGHRPDAWDIDTDRLLQNFAAEIRAQGGQVRTGQEVRAIARLRHGWEVTAGGERIAARVIVNAAGAWADGVAGMAGIAPLGITPYRRSMARLPAPGGHDTSGWPMVMGLREAWYAKPDAGALLVSPAEEDPAEPHDAWADDMVLAEGLARYEAFVTEPVTRLMSNWAGLRSFAPDRNLVLGPEPGDPSFVWAAGQGGYGIQTAPAASALLADLVAGRTPELEPEMVARLRPDRLR